MHLLVLVFAGSTVVLLLAAWAVLRAVRRHGKRSQGEGASLSLKETMPVLRVPEQEEPDQEEQ